MPLLGFVVYVLLCLLACRIAVRRGYHVLVGMIPGLLLPRLAWLLLCFLPRTSAASEWYKLEAETQRELDDDSRIVPCLHCGRRNSVHTIVCPRCDRHVAGEQRRAA